MTTCRWPRVCHTVWWWGVKGRELYVSTTQAKAGGATIHVGVLQMLVAGRG